MKLLKRVTLSSFACSLLLFALVSTSCDGVLGIQGTVYEWVDPPFGATGVIYIDAGLPLGIHTKPLEGATIIITTPGGRGAVNTTSSTQGKFTDFDVVAPGVIKYRITVEHNQFESVSKEFLSLPKRGASSSRLINVLMVRETP